jgi:hypothetical protein
LGPRAPFRGSAGPISGRGGKESLVWLESVLWRHEPEASTEPQESGALRGSYGALPVLACAVPGVGLIYEASRLGSGIARCGLAGWFRFAQSNPSVPGPGLATATTTTTMTTTATTTMHCLVRHGDGGQIQLQRKVRMQVRRLASFDQRTVAQWAIQSDAPYIRSGTVETNAIFHL